MCFYVIIYNVSNKSTPKINLNIANKKISSQPNIIMPNIGDSSHIHKTQVRFKPIDLPLKYITMSVNCSFLLSFSKFEKYLALCPANADCKIYTHQNEAIAYSIQNNLQILTFLSIFTNHLSLAFSKSGRYSMPSSSLASLEMDEESPHKGTITNVYGLLT